MLIQKVKLFSNFTTFINPPTFAHVRDHSTRIAQQHNVLCIAECAVLLQIVTYMHPHLIRYRLISAVTIPRSSLFCYEPAR